MAPGALPTELVNLLALHSSFLTALSLHYAHNGTASPVDLRTLTASISAVWQKRKVTLDDIRLCLGILSAGPSGNANPFTLSDYSGGKICLEILPEHLTSGALGPLNEDALQAMFMQNLDHLWRAWSASQTRKTPSTARPIATPKRRGRPRKSDTAQQTIESFVTADSTSLPTFLSQLPHATISICPSLAGVAPLHEKGRKRLRDIKDSVQAGRAQKKSCQTPVSGKENAPALANPQQPKITAFASVRKTNLLDRILAKQALSESSATCTPAEAQRKAALQRSEEILGVLGLLAAGKGAGARVSFSMNALVQAVQGSIRSPLSKEEVRRCVEVLAEEVAPGYVSVVRLGAFDSVVLNAAVRPVDVRQRLVKLGAV